MNKLRKIGKIIWDNKRLIFVFIFSFLVYEFIAFSNNNNDPIAMYSFSHAIKMGEVPYRDFSLVSTPFYAFLMSIGLFVFDNYLMFILEQCVLVTMLFYFLFRLFDKKAWFVLLGMSVCTFFGFLPTYNFMCFLLMVLLVYLEKRHSEKDFLIGLTLGLAVLSKHTVGIFLVLTTIVIHFGDLRKLVKRTCGFLVPWIFFLIYLLINEAVYDFINLTVLGLFDFGGHNSNFQGLYFYASIVIFILMVITLVRNRKDKYNYYLICGLAFCIPLFDLNHFSLLFNCFTILGLNYIEFGKNINFYSRLSIGINLLYSILYFICISSLGVTFYTELNHFNYMYNFKSDYEKDLKVNAFLDQYEDKNIIILSGYTMFYDIVRDREISYFDVLLYGNHGYNGTQTMINKIEEKKNVYIIVDMEKYESSTKTSQYNKEIVKYVVDNYEVIDSKHDFNVYYKQ